MHKKSILRFIQAKSSIVIYDITQLGRQREINSIQFKIGKHLRGPPTEK